MTTFEWVAVAVVAVTSAARITRLMIWDVYPPVAWLRAQWTMRAPAKWEPLLKCGYCFAPYPTLAIVLWGYFTDWQTAWWIVNGTLGAAYAAAIMVTFDGEIAED